MIHQDAIRRLRGNADWLAVEAHIREQIKSLDTTAGIEGDDRQMAIEVLGRRRAAEKLRAIIEPFEIFEEEADMAALVREKEAEAGL